MRSSVRVGTGAGFSADRLDPALDLVEQGELDVIVFECIGERTLAFGHRDRMADPQAGYNALLERRMRAVLPACVAHGTRLITNMGVANPQGAAQRTAAIARELGLKGLQDRRARGRRRAPADRPRHGPARSADRGRRGRARAGRRQRLSRRRRPAAGARRRRGRADHRAGRRSQPVPGAASPGFRLGRGRLAGARRGHHGRPPDGVRRPGHRRLLRRSRLQGRAEPRLCGLSDRRGRRPTAAP